MQLFNICVADSRDLTRNCEAFFGVMRKLGIKIINFDRLDFNKGSLARFELEIKDKSDLTCAKQHAGRIFSRAWLQCLE